MSQVPETQFKAPPALDTVIAEPADASALLQKRLELTARAMRLLQKQLSRADDRLATLDARNDSLEASCTRAEQLSRALDSRPDEPPPQFRKPRTPSPGFFSPPAPDPHDETSDAPRASDIAEGAAPRAVGRAPEHHDPDSPPPENPDHALHTLIDDLVARCAILERERAEASTAERALLAGLHDELRDGLADLSSSLTSLSTSKLDERQHSLLDPALVSIGALTDLVAGLRDLSPAPSAGTGAGANSSATAHANPGASSPDSQSSSSANSPTFDLRAAIDGIAEFLSRRASERNIELVCTIAPDVPPLVAGDRARLRQVVLHVVSAAVHVAHHGRVTLTISVDSLAEDHVVVRTTVAHEGTGLDPALLGSTNSSAPAILPAAAAPEFEAPAAARPIDVAGLTAARQLIERMGGTVGVESEQNARFTIWFTLTWPRPDRKSGSRRAENRLRVEAVESSVGPVLDLSLGGARVTSKKRLSGRIPIEIRDAGDTASRGAKKRAASSSPGAADAPTHNDSSTNNSVTLQADVSWSRRIGWRRFESGLRFVDITPDAARRLTRLSMEHRVRALLGDKS